MSVENKGLVRRLFQEVWNRGNLAAADEIFTPDYVSHGHAPDVLSVGVPAFKERVSIVLSRFADLEMTLQDLIAEEDKVVAPVEHSRHCQARMARHCSRRQDSQGRRDRDLSGR